MNQFFADYRIAISRVFSIIILLLVLLSKPQYYGSLLYYVMFVLGNILVVIGILGRIFASIFMSDNRNVNLVSTGLYSITRNPLYLFSFIGTVGIGMVYGSITIMFVLIIAYLIYYRFVISYEEQNLSKRLGASYIAYINSEVPRFFPKISLWKSEEYLNVNYKVVLQTMVDAFWFFFVILILSVWLKLQDLSWVPSLFTII